MRNILLLFLGCIILNSCDREFIYNDKTTEIIGMDLGECIEKKQASIGSFGEWYICETYKFENNEDYSRLHNSLYSDSISWIIQDWSNLPVDSNIAMNDVVFNYCGTARTQALSREMKKINASGCGYYSFCVKPSINNPCYIVFCMLDTNNAKLFVVDAHL